MKYLVDTMELEDWNQVRSIYYEGISTGNATFESTAPDWEKWDSTHLLKKTFWPHIFVGGEI